MKCGIATMFLSSRVTAIEVNDHLILVFNYYGDNDLYRWENSNNRDYFDMEVNGGGSFVCVMDEVDEV